MQLTLELSAEQTSALQSLVDEGGAKDLADAVRRSIELLRERELFDPVADGGWTEDELRSEIEAGRASGDAGPLDWSDIRREVERRQSARRDAG
jgi:Arc/MetJ-type ribon-helix-helix transcriptional regulator